MAVTCDTEGPTFTAGGDADWFRQTSTYYSGTDAAESGDIDDSEESWMQTSLQGEGTVTFWWKVSSESGYDELEFYLDDVLKHSISGEVDWQQKSYTVTGAGSHTLKWRYVKDSSASDGSDCGWVDCLQWSGYIPVAVPTVWDAISYTYDPAGRDIKELTVTSGSDGLPQVAAALVRRRRVPRSRRPNRWPRRFRSVCRRPD